MNTTLDQLINEIASDINNQVVESLVVDLGYDYNNAIKVVNEFEGFGPDLDTDSTFWNLLT